MANLTEDELSNMVSHAVQHERDRCARLNEALAARFEASAARIRLDGTYTTHALWPLFKKVTSVYPKWERAAKDVEACANSLRAVAKCIRAGYEP